MGQKRFLMSQKELQRYHVMSKILEGRMTTPVCVSHRQVGCSREFKLKQKTGFSDKSKGSSLRARRYPSWQPG